MVNPVTFKVIEIYKVYFYDAQVYTNKMSFIV